MKNIPLFKVFMSPDCLQPVNDILMSGYIGQGDKVDEFERLLGDYIGNPHINTVNSGTSALHLALHMIKDGATEERNEILTTPLTCTATNLPIISHGLNIKWVDLDPKSCNLDLVDLRRKISPKTLGIMLVHWGGTPVDLAEVRKIQQECERLYGYFPPVIEDCAHAMGATFRGGLPLGNHGNYCMFSFQSIKHLTTVDGGMLVCPNDESYKRSKLMRWYGLDRNSSADFRCQQIIGEDGGYKFHMNDVAATIGIHNLKHFPELLEKHRKNAAYLQQELQAYKDESNKYLTLLDFDPSSAYWVFTIRIKMRNAFVKYAKDKGIGVSQVHDRNDKHLCFSKFKASLPVTDEVCADMICLPCGWWLEKDDLDYIIDTVKEFCN